MRKDWFFPIPEGDFDTQEMLSAQWLAADPVACTISDEEAETFFTSAYVLQRYAWNEVPRIWRRLGVKVSYTGPHTVLRGNVLALRQWKRPSGRRLLVSLITHSKPHGFPAPTTHGDEWTEELFNQAWADGFNLLWLIQTRRYLGKASALSTWMQQLGPKAEQSYRIHVNVARIWLRRIVYPTAEIGHAQDQVAAALQESLTEDLREKDMLSGILRKDVRRLEQDRRRLRKAARRAEHEARQAVLQARGEVRVARRDFKIRLAALERERLAQSQRLEREIAALRQEIAAVRLDFVRHFSDRAAEAPPRVLAGRTFMVSGSAANREIYRVLVESYGGILVETGGTFVIPASASMSDVERTLRSLAIQNVLIKCDGLYRRKGGRPGIAMAGFQVHLGKVEAGMKSAVVCCGPVAGSFMAEYGAIVMALSWLLKIGPAPGAEAEIWSDCKWMLQWIDGRRPRPNRLGCATLHGMVQRLMRRLKRQGCKVVLRWVPREKVHDVDRLCDRAYHGVKWYHARYGRPRSPLSVFLRKVSF